MDRACAPQRGRAGGNRKPRKSAHASIWSEPQPASGTICHCSDDVLLLSGRKGEWDATKVPDGGPWEGALQPAEGVRASCKDRSRSVSWFRGTIPTCSILTTPSPCTRQIFSFNPHYSWAQVLRLPTLYLTSSLQLEVWRWYISRH